MIRLRCTPTHSCHWESWNSSTRCRDGVKFCEFVGESLWRSEGRCGCHEIDKIREKKMGVGGRGRSKIEGFRLVGWWWKRRHGWFIVVEGCDGRRGRGRGERAVAVRKGTDGGDREMDGFERVEFT